MGRGKEGRIASGLRVWRDRHGQRRPKALTSWSAQESCCPEDAGDRIDPLPACSTLPLHATCKLHARHQNPLHATCEYVLEE